MRGNFFIISGPSGAGKSALISRLRAEFDDIYFSISSTTRAPREGERDGIDYHFISDEEFRRGIDEGDFLEYAFVHKNLYGTALSPCLAAARDGKSVIFDIDVQGFEIAMGKFSELITSIFITTPSRAELARRLRSRGTDDEASIEKRLSNSLIEMRKAGAYDYFLVNDDLNVCYANLRAIFIGARHRAKALDMGKFIEIWNLK